MKEGYVILIIAFGLAILMAGKCQAETYKVTLTTGTVKTFQAKSEAVRFVLLNQPKVKTIEEMRYVALTEKLSFKKIKGEDQYALVRGE